MGATWQTTPVEAANPLALDGTAQAASGVLQTCDTGSGLSTTKSPDVLIAVLWINDTTTTITSGPTNDAGLKTVSTLTWALRKSVSATVQEFEYYAVAGSTVSSLGVTFSLSGNSHTTQGTLCSLFAVSGIDRLNPFDNRPELAQSNSGNSASAAASFLTNQQNDMLLFIEGDCASANGGVQVGMQTPTGWTQVSNPASATANGCVNTADLTIEEMLAASSIHTTLTTTGVLAASNSWVTIADALTVSRSGGVIGCGFFNGGYCGTPAGSTGFTGFQVVSVCPTGNSTLSIGCLALPSQLTGPTVPYLIGSFVGVALVLTSFHPASKSSTITVLAPKRKTESATRQLAISSLLTASLTLTFDYFFHLTQTSPMEVPVYFAMKFLSALPIAYFLVPRIGLYLSALVFTVWVDIYYGLFVVLLGISWLSYSPNQVITIDGVMDQVILFTLWTVLHGLFFLIGALLAFRPKNAKIARRFSLV